MALGAKYVLREIGDAEKFSGKKENREGKFVMLKTQLSLGVRDEKGSAED